jgi:hypothetical protein
MSDGTQKATLALDGRRHTRCVHARIPRQTRVVDRLRDGQREGLRPRRFIGGASTGAIIANGLSSNWTVEN